MKTKFMAVMFVCFIFGGYSILNFSAQMYDFWFRMSVMESADASVFMNITNITNRTGLPSDMQLLMRDFRGPQGGRTFPGESLLDLVGGIVSIVAGITIWLLLREDELDSLKEEMADTFLLPEEKAIINELKKAGGEMTQKELVSRTGLTKVKIHRVISKLEAKNIIKRYPYGMTKKIVIEKTNGKKEKPSSAS